MPDVDVGVKPRSGLDVENVSMSTVAATVSVLLCLLVRVSPVLSPITGGRGKSLKPVMNDLTQYLFYTGVDLETCGGTDPASLRGSVYDGRPYTGSDTDRCSIHR